MKVKRTTAVLLSFCLMVSCAYAESGGDVLESIGGWFSQAWEDTSKWAEQALDDASKWAEEVWKDAPAWIENAWGDASKWIEQAWNKAIRLVAGYIQESDGGQRQGVGLDSVGV